MNNKDYSQYFKYARDEALVADSAIFENVLYLLTYDGPNPTNAEEAFDISISKWQELYKRPALNNGTNTCGLCMYFHNHGTHDCGKCPIAMMGHSLCDNTAYRQYCQAQDSLNPDTDLLSHYASQEVVFLTNLKFKYMVRTGFTIEKHQHYSMLRYDGPKPTTTLEALDISITKWEIMTNNPDIGDGAASTCGLCMRFLTKHDCGECPIALDGHPSCNGTPYEVFCVTEYNDLSKDLAERELAMLKELKEAYLHANDE